MSIENLINDVKNGDNVAASKQFNSVMADKLAAALDAKKQAENLLSDKKSAFDHTRAATELSKAIAQLRAIKKIRRS